MTDESTGLDVSRLSKMHKELNGDNKGKRLEDFCAEFFDQVDGVEVYERNIVDDLKSQEIDIIVWNGEDDGLSGMGQYFFVEAKNWSNPVGSAEVAWFDWKLRLGGAAAGFLVATSGITGRAEDASSAWTIIYEANRDGRTIILTSPNELMQCALSGTFRELVKRKILKIAARKSYFEA